MSCFRSSFQELFLKLVNLRFRHAQFPGDISQGGTIGFFHPLNTGQESTPGGAFEIAYLLGKDETLARMKKSLEKLG